MCVPLSWKQHGEATGTLDFEAVGLWSGPLLAGDCGTFPLWAVFLLAEQGVCAPD